MAIYSFASNTTVQTSAAPAWDIKASTQNSPKLYELSLNIGQAVTSIYYFGRPANDGSVIQSAPVSVLADNSGDPAGQTTTAVAWGTAPTQPNTNLRRITFTNVIANGIIWVFPRGLVFPVTKGAVVWNAQANANNLTIAGILDE